MELRFPDPLPSSAPTPGEWIQFSLPYPCSLCRQGQVQEQSFPTHSSGEDVRASLEAETSQSSSLTYVTRSRTPSVDTCRRRHSIAQTCPAHEKQA